MLDQEQGSFLVFARTKHGAEKLAKKLSREGLKTTAIHGNRSQSQRTQALRGFQDGEYRVLVATDVAARGLDISGVSHVINYDVPTSPDVYVHRIGRTGRVGRSGRGITFFEPQQRRDQSGPRGGEDGADVGDVGHAANCPGSKPSTGRIS